MVNYQLGKIYKLYCVSDESLFYIGSTAQKTLADRLKGHVSSYKNYCNGKYNYMTSFKIIETGNYKIELLESYPCDNRDELTAREGFHIRANSNCVNKKVDGRTNKEWRNENNEKYQKYQEQYYEANKEKIKQYREDNKEKIKEYMKQYREANKDKMKEYHNQKFICACGKTCNMSSRSNHLKSKKHQAWVEASESSN